MSFGVSDNLVLVNWDLVFSYSGSCLSEVSETEQRLQVRDCCASQQRKQKGAIDPQSIENDEIAVAGAVPH